MVSIEYFVIPDKTSASTLSTMLEIVSKNDAGIASIEKRLLRICKTRTDDPVAVAFVKFMSSLQIDIDMRVDRKHIVKDSPVATFSNYAKNNFKVVSKLLKKIIGTNLEKSKIKNNQAHLVLYVMYQFHTMNQMMELFDSMLNYLSDDKNIRDADTIALGAIRDAERLGSAVINYSIGIKDPEKYIGRFSSIPVTSANAAFLLGGNKEGIIGTAIFVGGAAILAATLAGTTTTVVKSTAVNIGSTLKATNRSLELLELKLTKKQRDDPDNTIIQSELNTVRAEIARNKRLIGKIA